MRFSLQWAITATCICVTGLAIAQAPNGSPSPPPGGYTVPQLESAIRKLGYDVEYVGAAKDTFRISNTRDQWKVSFTLRVDTLDARRVWCDICLARFGESTVLCSDAIRELLEENHRLAPTFYRYDKTGRTLHLTYGFDNSAMSPVRLRSEIDRFDDQIRKGENRWRFCNLIRLGVVPAGVSQPVLSAMQGEWIVVDACVNGVSTKPSDLATYQASIQANQMTLRTPAASAIFQLVVDPRRPIPAIDLTGPSGIIECGIYRLDGDTLSIVAASLNVGGDRPISLEPKSREKITMITLKRKI